MTIFIYNVIERLVFVLCMYFSAGIRKTTSNDVIV